MPKGRQTQRAISDTWLSDMRYIVLIRMSRISVIGRPVSAKRGGHRRRRDPAAFGHVIHGLFPAAFRRWCQLP
jgi:hypothetical protein